MHSQKCSDWSVKFLTAKHSVRLLYMHGKFRNRMNLLCLCFCSLAYFDQMREQLNEDATLADTISPGSDFVEIGNERKHVISYLEDFLFPPQRSRSPVKSLSGGAL